MPRLAWSLGRRSVDEAVPEGPDDEPPRRSLAHILLAGTLGARALAAHLALPLVLTVRGTPFLALLLLRPSEATVVVAGAQVRDGQLRLLVVVATAAAGAVAADLLGYLAGRLWGGVAVARLTRHGGRRAGRAVSRAQALVRDQGLLAVAAARPTVVTHGVVPVLAGTAGMTLRRFIPASAAGAVVWAAAWVAGGAGLGAGWSALPMEARLGAAAAAVAGSALYVGACVLRPACPNLLGRHAG